MHIYTQSQKTQRVVEVYVGYIYVAGIKVFYTTNK